VGEKKPSTARLGRGLSTLLGDAPAAAPPASAAGAAGPVGDGLRVVPIERIRPNAAQPRKRIDDDALAALAESIATTGLIQPVVVRDLGGGDYELIAGERRWRAAQAAGLAEIPAVVRDADERERLEVGLVENLVRQDLDPIETAHALATLVEDFGQSQADVARSVGRSRSSVANLIRLLELPEDVQDMLVAGTLSEGHGRAILMADGARRRRAVAEKAVEQGLSVRATEALARRHTDEPASARAPRTAPGIADEAIDAFAGAFEAPVRVRTAAKGRVVVEIVFEDEAAVAAALDLLPGGPARAPGVDSGAA
jgi:ParB family transcriptional regulator, chromosome partitioning protein